MANDTRLQNTLREEISGVCGDRAPSNDDREKLPLVDSLIQEVIRFSPPAPLSVPRRAVCDVVLNGRKVPMDAGLLINVYAVNRDTDIWGEDADEFKPERFLSASQEQISNGANSFGVGVRACPGEKMAQAEIIYCLVRVLQKVEMSCPLGDGTADFTPNTDLFFDIKRQDVNFKML